MAAARRLRDVERQQRQAALLLRDAARPRAARLNRADAAADAVVAAAALRPLHRRLADVELPLQPAALMRLRPEPRQQRRVAKTRPDSASRVCRS